MSAWKSSRARLEGRVPAGATLLDSGRGVLSSIDVNIKSPGIKKKSF